MPLSTLRRSFAGHAPLCFDLVPTERVSDRLRVALLQRAEPADPNYRARACSQDQLATLRAMLSRILPDADAYGIDLAARLDTMMSEQEGNGWRYEALPTDPDAYRIGLDTLDALARARIGQPFRDLSEPQRDEMLERIAAAEEGLSDGEGLFDTRQMKLWFEEVRSDAVRHYVAHPAIMARIGYSGFANGHGTGPEFQGFTQVGIEQRETWEPSPTAPSKVEEVAR